MKLTIGMMVKNEEKWLERCITAIRPILDNVDSELIITDTGSTDRTVEIAEKYADKVLHFEWTGDFSEARNTVFEVASGEWFMVLDPDDIFLSCDSIIDFFNSENYKNYNSAAYISRNLFKTEKGTSHNDFYAARMVKILPETRYKNAIHEVLTTYGPPCKMLSDIAEHYGYYYETENDRNKKFNRNIELLLKRYEEEKDTTPMLYIQIYETYMAVEKTDEALYYLNEGIELCQKNKDPVLLIFLFHKSAFYQTSGKFKEAVGICRQYLDMRAINPEKRLYSDGEIYGILAKSLYSLEDYTMAIKYYIDFFTFYNELVNGNFEVSDVGLIASYLCCDVNIIPMFNEFLTSCIKTGDVDSAIEYMTYYPLNLFCKDDRRTAELIVNEISVLDKLQYQYIEKCWQKLDNSGKLLIAETLLIRLYISKCDETVINAISEIRRYDKELENKAEVITNYYHGSKDTDVILSAAELMIKCTLHSRELYEINKNEIIKVEHERLFEDLWEAKERFAICCNKQLTDRPAIIIASESVGHIIKLRETKQYRQCISEIKKAINIYAPLAPILSEYSKCIMDDLSSPNPQTEMQILMASIKRNIRAYIAAGNIASAEKTLIDYKKIAPNDPDIAILINELRNLA